MDLIESAENGDIERVNELLEQGVNPDIQDNYGRTALISASKGGYLDIVELLLEYHADIHIKNRQGYSALLLATMGNHIDICILLLEHGADINTSTRHGLTPLMISARWKPELLNLLIEGGANPFLKTISSRLIIGNDTAYDFAIEEGDLYAADTLRQYMAQYMATIKLQSRHRGRRTRNRIRTQRAKQHLSTSRLPIADDITEMIGEHLSRTSYHPDVTQRMVQERDLERAESRLNTAKTMNDRLSSQTPLRHLDYYDILQRLSRDL